MPKVTADIDTHLNSWRTSGLSQAAYCRLAGIPYHRLRDGLRREARRRDHAAGFVEVQRPARGSGAILELPGGMRLGFSDQADAMWVGRVVRSLAMPC
jgi:hypothetical protein